VIDRTALETPLSDWGSFAVSGIERYAEALLAERNQSGASLSTRLRSAVLAGLNKGGIDVNEIAKRLAISPRTLHRRLAAEGTTYRDVVKGVQKELAEQYLSNSQFNVDEVATRLGFADSRSFRRAFRQWTGFSPRVYREERALQGSS